MTEVLPELARIIRDVFLAPNAEISRNTTASDVQGWDSLSHIRMLLMIEIGFSIKFGPREAQRPANVGELADLIEHKLNEKHKP